MSSHIIILTYSPVKEKNRKTHNKYNKYNHEKEWINVIICWTQVMKKGAYIFIKAFMYKHVQYWTVSLLFTLLTVHYMYNVPCSVEWTVYVNVYSTVCIHAVPLHGTIQNKSLCITPYVSMYNTVYLRLYFTVHSVCTFCTVLHIYLCTVQCTVYVPMYIAVYFLCNVLCKYLCTVLCIYLCTAQCMYPYLQYCVFTFVL